MLEIFGKSPKLAAAICWCGTRESAILGGHIVRIGRRNATESISHLILELHRRLEMMKLVSGNTFDFPLTQDHIADTLGLTTVHVNRTLRRMKYESLIDYTESTMKISDHRRLSKTAGFDSAYLDHYDFTPP